MNTELIRRYASEIREEALSYRRYFHAHPELGFEETGTTARLASILEENHIPYVLNPGSTGLIARIQGQKPGKVLAFRSDIDALPVPELTGLPYASETPGKMHACGHDFHMGLLLAFGLTMARHPEEVEGTIVLIFQPNEEHYPGGAQGMIASGLLSDVDAFYGYHVAPEYPTGSICCMDGYVMACVTTFRIHIKGKSCHGSKPQDGADPIVAAAQIILGLQTIVSRNAHPCERIVVSCGQIHAGSCENIIPETAFLEGTIRTYTDEALTLVTGRMKAITEGIAASMGVFAEVEFEYSYPAVYNAPEHASRIRAAAEELGIRVLSDVYPSMVGEDFTYYLRYKTGGHFFLGVGGDGSGPYYALHSSYMAPDENAMQVGCELLLNLYEKAKEA